MKHFDVIIAGGGHAGAEAGWAAASLGARTLLVTGSVAAVGALSCNPAIGGVGKGHLVREIDALGGIMGRVADRATLQFRMLNRGKGPAVWSPRAQVDRYGYPQEVWKTLKQRTHLEIYEGSVVNVLLRGDRVTGVVLNTGRAGVVGERQELGARAVILCCGTFLNGMIHEGSHLEEGGRRGEPPEKCLTRNLESLGIMSRRFKTGTPPRVNGSGIDFDRLTRQDGEDPRSGFSFFQKRLPLRQLPCWITATSERTHEIIHNALGEAPLFTGQIKARGPRYCPSIEDKVVRFPDRNSHLIFIEPESRLKYEYYLNGLSTSLPARIQREIVHSVKGLELAEIVRYGYAIEYDYFPPEKLQPTLESKEIAGLFFAGQINGTTGYEEAAAQGLIAGINAAQTTLEKGQFVLPRTESAIGVLIDDLVTKGVTEPYRLFTSRIDYRLTVRADNADLRLSDKGRAIGLLSEEDYRLVERKRSLLKELRGLLCEEMIEPAAVNEYLEQEGSAPIEEPVSLASLLKRPEVSIKGLFEKAGLEGGIPGGEIAHQLELEVKYEGYCARERREIEKLNRLEEVGIPPEFPYEKVRNISTEAKEKLIAVKPHSLGQASRISGVSVSDLAAIVLELSRENVSRETS